MKLGWRSRHALALLALALVLVVISSIFEITNVLRLATDRAATEAALAIEPIQQVIAQLSEQHPEATIAELSQNPQVRRVLTPALAFAPSVATIVVCDPNGTAVAHAIPANRGRHIERLPKFPRPQGFRDAFVLLLELRDRQNYEISADLVRGERDFGSVRVHISGTLLGDEVRRVLRRGLVTAGIDILLAVGVGLLLGRMVAGPVRLLEQSVVAIREGRTDPIPDKGIDMFEHLARELSILRDRVQMEPRVLASVGQLATGMAHEIQQPIQAVKFAVSALRDARNMSGDEVDSYVETAKQAVDRLHNSVNGFLTVVRLKPMQLSDVDLNHVLTEVRDEMETEANLSGLELDLDLDRDVIETYADAQVLRQAIGNLVKNAIQATPSADGRIKLRSRYEPNSVEVSVEDTGPGIAPELKEKVFNFSFTTKERGTGVGLAIVRQAAEIHGGVVRLESQVGRGTSIVIRLPVRSASSQNSRS